MLFMNETSRGGGSKEFKTSGGPLLFWNNLSMTIPKQWLWIDHSLPQKSDRCQKISRPQVLFVGLQLLIYRTQIILVPTIYIYINTILTNLDAETHLPHIGNLSRPTLRGTNFTGLVVRVPSSSRWKDTTSPSCRPWQFGVWRLQDPHR